MSELSTMTRPSWVALHSKAHSFPKLDRLPWVPSTYARDLRELLRVPLRSQGYCAYSLDVLLSVFGTSLISFRMDWLDLLAVQGTLKSVLQHHSSKASILLHSAFFTVQLSHPYMTTGKTIALTRRTFVGKVMSLLLNMLSRLVITFTGSLCVLDTILTRYD